jgi:hypothetical protein
MRWEEAEQLAECIRTEAGKQIAVLGIEPFGGASNSSYPVDFFVKCACKTTNLRFVVKSLEHWKAINQHVIVRLCKLIYSFLKS